MSDENRTKITTNKIIKIVLVVLYQIIVILALILTFIIILQKVSDSNKTIGGYRIFRVITGSMEPEYQVGEVVISKEVNPKDIKVGDDIVYLGRYGEYAGKIIMHNVIEIDTDENGNLIFHAKGLHSSSVEDPQIKEEQIYGVVKYRAGILTILYDLATNIYSVFFIILVLVLNVFVAFNTPKKSKRHKIKQIANTNNKVEEEYEDEKIEYQVEEDEDEIADYDNVENEENIREEQEEEDNEDTVYEEIIHEKTINERMRQYYEKTVKNTTNEKNTRNKNNK